MFRPTNVFKIDKYNNSFVVFPDVGKCTLFTLATLQHLILAETHEHVLVITHSIESVSQIQKLYRGLSKYLAKPLNIESFTNVSEAIKARNQTLEITNHITVGTFDCVLELIKSSKRFENVQILILNASDDILVDQLGLFYNEIQFILHMNCFVTNMFFLFQLTDVHSDVDEFYKRLAKLQQIMLFSENNMEKIRKISNNINKELSSRVTPPQFCLKCFSNIEKSPFFIFLNTTRHTSSLIIIHLHCKNIMSRCLNTKRTTNNFSC